MKHYYPAYYPAFRCIASACSDNCCIGWEIDIDEKSDCLYRSVQGPFGSRLEQSIVRDENGSHFLLNQERCPFLNEQNLCDIFIHLGESALCEICTQHPRYHEWYGNWKESGVSLCCEAAGRLIFSQEGPAVFEQCEIDETASEEEIDTLAFTALFSARERAFQLVQDHSLSLAQRFHLLLQYGEALQTALNQWDLSAIQQLASMDSKAWPVFTTNETALHADCFRPLLTFLSNLDAIDSSWPDTLHQLEQQLPQLIQAQQTFHQAYPRWQQEMEQLSVYFLFRYFCKSLFDEDIRSKIMLPVLACTIIGLLDTQRFLSGGFSLEDRILTAKQFSKEIEYCTENLEALFNAYWEESVFSPTVLDAMQQQLFA